MPAFSTRSRERLSECHPDLQTVMFTAIENSPIDFGIVCGHRGKDEQDLACSQGKSKTPWPTSKHNATPSMAVDVFPVRDGKAVWDDKILFVGLAKHILNTANVLGVKVRWGGDWDADGDWKDEKFLDMPHFELMED